MGKKVNLKKDAAKQQPIEVVQDPQQIQQKQPMHKFLPHTKYIAKKEKNIKKARKQLIHYIHLDKFQIKNAVEALQQYSKTTGSGTNLFQDIQQGFIYLEIVLASVPSQYSIRPIQIPLPVPIYSQQYKSRFTVFCSQPERQYLEQIQNLDIPLMSGVIGYHNLKKNYQQTKDKFSLLSANDLFFCDWKIYNLLRKPLGKLFYEKKKIPFPIECQAKNLPQGTTYQQYLNNLVNYTYFMMGNGPVYNIKIGRLGMQVKDLVKNIIHGVYNTLPHILSKQVPMQRVRQISIKTFNSPSLPVYCNLSAKEKEVWHEQKKKQIAKPTKKSKSNSKIVAVC